MWDFFGLPLKPAMFYYFGKKWGTMGHLIMLNVLPFLGIVRNYKPKQQQAKDHESLREAVKLVQEQGYSIRKDAAENILAF